MTFLAAAYMPLNLATGVFSMNIREITGTGHWMWDVIVTAFGMLIATAIFWWLVRASSTGVMIGLGIWGCRWRELQPMAFGGSGSGSGSGGGATSKAGDEGGDYEMAPVEE